MNSPTVESEGADPSAMPTLRGNEPFIIVMNKGSGRNDAEQEQATIKGVLSAGGRECEFLLVEKGSELISTAQRAVEIARKRGGIVVAAGGDGTLNAVGGVVLGTGLPFGILPQGTFNYFGRAHGISQDTATAARCLLDARIKPVQVGMVNDRIFLVNASFGLYPKLLEDREAYKQRYGRSRWVALWSALVTLMHAHRQLRVQLEFGEEVRTMKTPTIVVDNNMLQLQHMGVEEADQVKRDHLVAMTSRPVGTAALYGILIRGLLSRLAAAENVITFSFTRMTVRLGSRRRIKVATDGEIFQLNTPLQFVVAEHKLPLLVPRDGNNDGSTG